MCPFILKNGKFVAVNEKLFQYSDFETLLFSERFRAIRNTFPFFRETVDLLHLKFRILNQPVPEILNADGKEMKRQMERLLVKNKLYKSAVVKTCFFRKEKNVEYIISAEALETFRFEINKKGLLVDVFDKIPKAVSGLSNLSFGSEALWKMAVAHLPGSGIDDFLLINSEEKIIEGIAKKLLLVKGNKLTGVSVSSGAYMDVSGTAIPAIAGNLGLSFSEDNGFSMEDLYEADELILLDSVNGIQWVLGFREKRYYNIKAKLINKELNKLRHL
jgi:branched-chain amino acid aminotransferase